MPVMLSIFGPGMEPEHQLTRKILKGAKAKNWRLDGEFVHNPEDNPERYDSLVPGDYAVMAFHGEPKPAELQLILVSTASADDEPLYSAIDGLMGESSMTAVNREMILDAVASAVPSDHPLNEVLLDGALEDAAQGGTWGVEELLSRPSGAKCSAEQSGDRRRVLR